MADDIRKAYSAMKVTNFHRRMKLKAIEYKGGKCKNCQYSKSPAALVFHHRDPKEKDFSISRKVLGWERLQPELDKCDLLCSNCHNEEHERLHLLEEEERNREVRKHIPERVPVVTLTHSCLVCKSAFQSERYSSQFCSIACSAKRRERLEWPSEEALRKLVEVSPITTIAKDLGVSDVAVRKRCQKLGIKTHGRGHWKK
jgi:hypothetical protein